MFDIYLTSTNQIIAKKYKLRIDSFEEWIFNSKYIISSIREKNVTCHMEGIPLIFYFLG